MNPLEVLNLIVERGLATGISIVFVAAVAGLIRIGLIYLKKRVDGQPFQKKRRSKLQSDSAKIRIIVSKALINAQAKRVNYMEFYYYEEQAYPKSEMPSFMRCEAEECDGDTPSLIKSLTLVSTTAYPVFIAALIRDKQILLNGENREPNYVKSVYEFHDACESEVLCVLCHDLTGKPAGYIFAKKDAWRGGDATDIINAATYIGLLQPLQQEG